MAFMAWKDEAFELGSLWATLYEKTSPPTATLIHGMMDSFYLGKFSLSFKFTSIQNLTSSLQQ